MKKRIMTFTAVLLALSLFIPSLSVKASDGAINQSIGHQNEVGMYRYDIDIHLYNPCNSNDMDEDAVCELWFDFEYKADNGYGTSATYRFDMSWDDKKDRNLNSDILFANFIRPNDNECMKRFSVWVPGIVKNVKVHLNMDGGERLAFTVSCISLGGYRINTNTDYVSSAYYDSNAEINCRAPEAAICEKDADGIARDQYGAIFTENNIKKSLDNTDMLYHYKYNK